MLDVSSRLADDKRNDIRIEAALAKLYGSELGWTAVDEMVQVRGGRAYETAESLARRGEKPVPAEQMLRDMRINRIFEGSTEIMHLLIAREAVDEHLKVAGDVVLGDAGFADKAKAAAKAGAFYAKWFPTLTTGAGQRPGSYSEFGELAKHLRYVERHSRKLARSTFYAMGRYQARLERRATLLGRIVDIGAELYAIACACVYADTIGREQPDRREEAVELADLFCGQARRRADRLFARAVGQRRRRPVPGRAAGARRPLRVVRGGRARPGGGGPDDAGARAAGRRAVRGVTGRGAGHGRPVVPPTWAIAHKRRRWWVADVAPVRPGSSGFGHASRVATGIVRCRFDRCGRKRLGCVREQLGRIVGHRLVRVDLPIRFGQRVNHAMSQPARRGRARRGRRRVPRSHLIHPGTGTTVRGMTEWDGRGCRRRPRPACRGSGRRRAHLAARRPRHGVGDRRRAAAGRRGDGLHGRSTSAGRASAAAASTAQAGVGRGLAAPPSPAARAPATPATRPTSTRSTAATTPRSRAWSWRRRPWAPTASSACGSRSTHLGQDNREFVALGTAVRAAGPAHPPRPFVTDLPGADVAKLLHAGWVPVSIAFGISVAVRHDDYATRAGRRVGGQHRGVRLHRTRPARARTTPATASAEHAARAGADGAIVSYMGLRIWEHEPAEGHRDHVAESTVFGTTLARFHRGRTAPTRALTILPLRRA